MSKWVHQFRSKVKKIIPHTRRRVLDETYDIKDTLGEGLFSVVKKAVNRKTGELVAIKIYDKSRVSVDEKACFAREIELLKSIKHPNVITLKDCLDTRSKVYLIQELMIGGDLLSLLGKKKRLSERCAAHIFSQLLSALSHIHSKDIAHRDIKPDNILLSSDNDDAVVKLTDFGFAKKMGASLLHTPCGSPVYTAPEIISEDSYDKSVDVWSAGVLLYVMLCGFPPFYHQNPSKLFDEIKKATYEFPDEQWCIISDAAKDLISSMLKANPAERITAEKACNHPWFSMIRSDSNESISSFSSVKRESPPIPSSLSPSPSATSPISRSSPPSPSSLSPIASSTTTTASAADPDLERKKLKAKINKVLDQGTPFTLGPATSSPIWERRHKTKSNSTSQLECINNNDQNDKSEKSDTNENTNKREITLNSNNCNNNNKELRDLGTTKTSTESKKREKGESRESEDRSSFEAFSFSRSNSTTSEGSVTFQNEEL